MRTISFILVLAALGAKAQLPGSLDQSFNTPDTLVGQGNGPYAPDNGPIRMALTADGKILLAGSANTYNAWQSPGLVRVLPNGLEDRTFDVPFAYNTVVNALAPEPDGQVVHATVGGVFRVNANGSTDTGFNDGAGPNALVRAIAVQPDGRILVAGQFTTFNGQSRARIARLLADGSLDPSFVPGLAFDNTIWSIDLTASGQVLVAGAFTNAGYAAVARLNSDGSLDAGFVPPTGITGVVNDVEALPNGTVLIGGAFDAVGHSDIGRLTNTGGWDPAFTPGYFSGLCGGEVRDIVPYDDGRCLVIGCFTSYGGETVNSIVRLQANGSRDASFQSNGGFGTAGLETPTSAAVLPTGEILVARGWRYRDVPCARLMRLFANGDRDMSFNRVTGQNIRPSRVVVQNDGRILVTGAEIHQGEAYPLLIRLLPNGDRDPGFNIGNGPRTSAGVLGMVNTVLPLADGRLIVGGSFTQFNGVAARNLVRLMPGGTVDPTFSVGTGPNFAVNDVLVTADGKLLVHGAFTTFNGTPVNKLIRLLPDGALDATFQQPVLNGNLSSFMLGPGGKIIIGGSFTTVGAVQRRFLARLMPDGALDASFDPGTGSNTTIESLAVQADGRVVFCGPFTTVAGVSRNHIARLNVDGGLDASFDPGGGFAGSPQIPVRVRLQADGRVLVGGSFYIYDGHGQEALIRLEPDGSVDLTFHGDGFHCNQRGLSTQNYAQVMDMAVQPDGHIVAVGYFDSYGAEAANGIARVHGGDLPGVALSVRAVLQGPVGSNGTFMFSTLRQNGLLPAVEPYTALGYPHVGGGGGETADFSDPATTNMVDWVVVELRDATDPSEVLYSRSCLLRTEGIVVGAYISGPGPSAGPLPLIPAPAGSYYVAIRHRDHLGAMTAEPVSLSSTTTTIDFTDPDMQTWGTTARTSVNGNMVLWPGDANGDGVTQYTGSGNDRDAVLQAIGGIIPTNTVTNVYDRRDVNMDGNIIYTGANNDRDVILQAIGGVVPTAVRVEQLP